MATSRVSSRLAPLTGAANTTSIAATPGVERSTVAVPPAGFSTPVTCEQRRVEVHLELRAW